MNGLGNNVKAVVLMSLLAGILIGLGNRIGGVEGIAVATIASLLINGFFYRYSDTISLWLYDAQPLDKKQYPNIYTMVEALSSAAAIPMPRLWLIETRAANAFATGRNPHNSSIALTTGILSILEPHELRGVIAHEISHIVNRDTLVCTIAAIMATAIGYFSNLAYYASMRQRNGVIRGLGLMIFALFLPLITTIIRMGLSRSREYFADETGAHLCEDPLALASALNKIEAHKETACFSREQRGTQMTAGLFIIQPFRGESFIQLLSTHPPVKKRIAALYHIHANRSTNS